MRKGINNAVIWDAIKRGLRLEGGQLIMPSGKPWSGQCVVNGYRMVSVWGLGKRASVTYGRLVCWLVHGPPPNDDAQVDHINRDRSDDRPENLRRKRTVGALE